MSKKFKLSPETHKKPFPNAIKNIRLASKDMDLTPRYHIDKEKHNDCPMCEAGIPHTQGLSSKQRLIKEIEDIDISSLSTLALTHIRNFIRYKAILNSNDNTGLQDTIDFIKPQQKEQSE